MTFIGVMPNPKDVTDVFNKDPKFCVEPRMKTPDLLSVARNIRDMVQGVGKEASLAESLDCPLTFSLVHQKVRATSLVVSHLIEHVLGPLMADKEDGFVVMPSFIYGEKVAAAITKKFNNLKARLRS